MQWSDLGARHDVLGRSRHCDLLHRDPGGSGCDPGPWSTRPGRAWRPEAHHVGHGQYALTPCRRCWSRRPAVTSLRVLGLGLWRACGQWDSLRLEWKSRCQLPGDGIRVQLGPARESESTQTATRPPPPTETVTATVMLLPYLYP